MSFFTSGMFWFFEGILFVFTILVLRLWLKEKGIRLPIWKYFFVIIWILFFEFSIAFVTTSLGENEPNAALMGGILFGLISIVSGVGLFRLLFTNRVTEPSTDNE